MKIEKFTIVNISPSSRYDLYIQHIRKPDSSIKQVGTPNDMDSREIEVNTEELLTENKEVQFCYDDDTLMYQLMDAVVISKRQTTKSKDYQHSSVRKLLQENQTRKYMEYGEDTESVDHFQMAGRLSSFLQKSTLIFDALLKSNKLANYSQPESSKTHSLFCKSLQKQFGDRSSDGSLELIKYRKISHVSCCKKNPSMFLAYHYYDDDNSDNDLRPFKVNSFISDLF